MVDSSAPNENQQHSSAESTEGDHKFSEAVHKAIDTYELHGGHMITATVQAGTASR